MSEHVVPNYTRAFVTPQVKAVNDDEREVLHLISTAAVDRAGDIVEPSGARVDNFLKNPVVLVDHDYRTEKIVGKAVKIEVSEKGIWARTKFRDTPLGQDAFNLAKEGIGGYSIGFRPMKHESLRDDKGNFKGFHFKEWELLEYSVVAIPMNQEIVNNAVTRGLVQRSHLNEFFKGATEPEPTPADAAPDGATVEVSEPCPVPKAEVDYAAHRIASVFDAAEFENRMAALGADED